jgi:hypothetical protein
VKCLSKRCQWSRGYAAERAAAFLHEHVSTETENRAGNCASLLIQHDRSGNSKQSLIVAPHDYFVKFDLARADALDDLVIFLSTERLVLHAG